MRYRYWASAVASIILGLVFIFSGVGKLLHQIDFLNILLNNSFLTTFLAHVVAYALPWAELILGALLIAGISVKLMASLSAVIVAGFVASNSWLIAQGRIYEPCGCFGVFEKLVMGELSTIESLIFDIVMFALLLVILFCYPGKFFETRFWFSRKK